MLRCPPQSSGAFAARRGPIDFPPHQFDARSTFNLTVASPRRKFRRAFIRISSLPAFGLRPSRHATLTFHPGATRRRRRRRLWGGGARAVVPGRRDPTSSSGCLGRGGIERRGDLRAAQPPAAFRQPPPGPPASHRHSVGAAAGKGGVLLDLGPAPRRTKRRHRLAARRHPDDRPVAARGRGRERLVKRGGADRGEARRVHARALFDRTGNGRAESAGARPRARIAMR